MRAAPYGESVDGLYQQMLMTVTEGLGDHLIRFADGLEIPVTSDMRAAAAKIISLGGTYSGLGRIWFEKGSGQLHVKLLQVPGGKGLLYLGTSRRPWVTQVVDWIRSRA